MIRLVEGNFLHLRAHRGSIPSFSEAHGAVRDDFRILEVPEVDELPLESGRGWVLPERCLIERQSTYMISRRLKMSFPKPRPEPDERESVQCYLHPYYARVLRSV